jgi:hypothetical protein
VLQDGLRRRRRRAGPREPGPLQDLGDVAVPAHLVAVPVARRQVRAHEAHGRGPVQREAHRDRPLHYSSFIVSPPQKNKSGSDFVCVRVHACHVHLRIDRYLVPHVPHDAPANTRHLEAGDRGRDVRPDPHAEEDADHLLAGGEAVPVVPRRPPAAPGGEVVGRRVLLLAARVLRVGRRCLAVVVVGLRRHCIIEPTVLRRQQVREAHPPVLTTEPRRRLGGVAATTPRSGALLGSLRGRRRV